MSLKYAPGADIINKSALDQLGLDTVQGGGVKPLSEQRVSKISDAKYDSRLQ